jgi:hypothetical protein
MKIEYQNGIYLVDGRPRRAERVRAIYPVECQRAFARALQKEADSIRANPKAISAAIANADRMVRKAESLNLEAAIDEEREIEWGAREAHS